VDLKARFDRTAPFGVFGRSGMHAPGDAFFADTAPDTAGDGEAARVRDVGALVLKHFAHGLVA
jgi:hypothetical protein